MAAASPLKRTNVQIQVKVLVTQSKLHNVALIGPKLRVQVLAGIDLERSTRNVDDVQKLQRYIKIAQLYLEDDDAVCAEQYFIKVCIHDLSVPLSIFWHGTAHFMDVSCYFCMECLYRQNDRVNAVCLLNMF